MRRAPLGALQISGERCDEFGANVGVGNHGVGISAMTGSAVGPAAKSAKERLVGSWTLLSLTAGEGAEQTLPYGPNPKGSMMVDANGRFSITVLRSDLPGFASGNRMTGTADENGAIVHGSIAYYGTYTIDEATLVITVRIEGSTFPNFAGGTQTRILSFDGDEVTYLNPTPSHGGAVAKVTYRRATASPPSASTAGAD
jgi:Lipocalin-like domain